MEEKEYTMDSNAKPVVTVVTVVTTAPMPGFLSRFVPAAGSIRRQYSEQADDELVEERAAIRQFDGGLSRADAEILARHDVQRLSTINAGDTEGQSMTQPSDHEPTRQTAHQRRQRQPESEAANDESRL